MMRLRNIPEVFNKVYLSLIAAGEASGTLDVSLARLAKQQEKRREYDFKDSRGNDLSDYQCL